MQSGHRGNKQWMLVFEPESPRRAEPLMGYTSSADTKSQVRLRFDTREDAEAYARRNSIDYRVEEPHEPTVKRAAYADNFRVDRKSPWTH